MAPEPPITRRKRTRPQPDDEVILSPAPASSAKKRRLNDAHASSPSTPKAFSALASAIGGAGGVLGVGRRVSTNKLNGRFKHGCEALESSDGESAQDLQIKSNRPAVKWGKFGLKNPYVRDATKSVYDVPDSGDELEDPTHANDSANGSANPQYTLPSTGQRANGPSKTANASPKCSASSRAVRGAKKHDEYEFSHEESERYPPQQGADIGTTDDIEEEEAGGKGSTTRGSLRGFTGRRQEIAQKQPPTPKGILTPRRKRLGRPPKSVAFDSEDNRKTPEVFFADLPSKSKIASQAKSKPNVAAPVGKGKASAADDKEQDKEEEEEEESEDDEVCVICSKPDSKGGNKIIFCDHCEKAFHQKCYKVPVIPKGDWFCRGCLQEDALHNEQQAIFPGLQTGSQEVSTSKELPDIPNFERHLHTMQRVLIDRCSGSRRIKLTGQTEAYEKTFQLVEQTILAGEGNSMMIIGARGCGKTTLVETIVSDLAADNKEAFHVVRLNGFIHTDDKLALKEIWRQLGKEMAVEDDLVNKVRPTLSRSQPPETNAMKTNNYADTLATLLALLSHPSEITGTEEGLTSESVVFVIDEFDLFATHARQTLLYNLFDIAQARKAPIAVLGLTTRIDVVESLEKRVKSRFSHRYVHLCLPKSLPAYWDICKQGLSIDEEDIESEGFDTTLAGVEEFLQYWNENIEKLQKTPSFQDHLEYHFYTTKSVPMFLTTWVLPLSALSATSPVLQVSSSSVLSVSLDAPDSKLHLLAALSDLDLALLIAAARLDIVAHTDTVNFAMAYDEYSSQMGKQRLQSASSGMLALGAGGRVWGRGVAAMSWERLVALGLLVPAGIGGRSNAIHGGLEGKMWKLDVTLEEIPAAVELPAFLGKWCSQI
ncbi:origin recognition complex subunit 4 C-terminus-domain-containing protein [Pseudomassariella vexata]|uniref:Origin recognition complex subunit 4 n=1 Tax=Pseudomassariella vexata TaxID=1141098 RepID=A0A1Y2DUH3_9PEZI|nr:origin recognition complex subunit 4 C-terminus-domain-containing protein [Pseudomassariella vexata]ORY62887.1 origin recognition complex subunit 4 C-terminus-domain-containing protein [Pseudomassariella vexata]